MARGFHPTGMFLASHSVFSVFPPATERAYHDVIRPPFGPSRSPRILVYVTSFDEVSPWPLTPYREASVFVSVRHGTMEGWYPLMMPVTGRVAMLGGRRRGFPKEMATVSLDETARGWAGSARRDGRLLLGLEVTGVRPIGDEFEDRRSHYFGAPVFTLTPPLRGPRVVATTVETLEERTASRLAGLMQVAADPGSPWCPLLRPIVPGYFERSRGATVLRHGRVAARFVPRELAGAEAAANDGRSARRRPREKAIA